jgi:hypothetical protein
LKCDGTRAEPKFRLSAKRTSQFKSAGASVQSSTGSRGVRISGSNTGYTMFRGSVKGTGYPLHSPVSPSLLFPSRASPCAITFQLDSTTQIQSLCVCVCVCVECYGLLTVRRPRKFGIFRPRHGVTRTPRFYTVPSYLCTHCPPGFILRPVASFVNCVYTSTNSQQFRQ